MHDTMRTYIILLLSCLFLMACHRQSPSGRGQESLPEDSLTLLNRQIASDSLNGDGYCRRARYYLSRDQLNLSLHDINKALSLDPSKSEYLITVSDIYLQMAKVDDARETLDKASDNDPLNPDIYLKLARLYLIIKDYSLCHQYVHKVLTLDKSNARAYFIDGYAWLEKGDTANAIRNFQLSVQYDQNGVDAYRVLGTIYSQKHDPLAVSYFKNARDLRPDDTDILYDLALAYQHNDRFDEAAMTYADILGLDSTNVKAYYNLGYINLVHTGNYPAAITYFTRAIGYDPRYVEAFYNRGLCYEILGDLTAARNDYHKALDIKTNYPKAIEGLNRLDKNAINSGH